MEIRKNTPRKLVSIAVLVLIFLNLCACGTSNHVVSKRLIQKRKYTSGWFVKLSKSQQQAKHEEFRAEVSPIQLSETRDCDQKVNLLVRNSVKTIEQKQEREIASTVFRTKPVRSKVETVARTNPEVTFTEVNSEVKAIARISSIKAETSNHTSRSSRRNRHSVDPWLVAGIIFGSITVLAFVLFAVLESQLFLMIGAGLLALAGLFLIGYGIYLFGQAVEEFFDMMFR